MAYSWVRSVVLVSTMFALRLVPRGVAKKGVISKKRGMPSCRAQNGVYHVIYHVLRPARMPRYIPPPPPPPPACPSSLPLPPPPPQPAPFVPHLRLNLFFKLEIGFYLHKNIHNVHCTVVVAPDVVRAACLANYCRPRCSSCCRHPR